MRLAARRPVRRPVRSHHPAGLAWAAERDYLAVWVAVDLAADSVEVDLAAVGSAAGWVVAVDWEEVGDLVVVVAAADLAEGCQSADPSAWQREVARPSRHSP